jgi:hypothetical protein
MVQAPLLGVPVMAACGLAKPINDQLSGGLTVSLSRKRRLFFLSLLHRGHQVVEFFDPQHADVAHR